MPEILESLFGVKFSMYYLDNDFHNRPHVHVKFGGYKASIAIDNIELLAGSLPVKKLKRVEQYILEHQHALLAEWAKAVQGKSIQRIN